MNKINIEELAEVSKIGFTEEEKIFIKQINLIVDFIGNYENEYDISREDRTISFDNIREDVSKPSLKLEDALKNTYKKKYSYFQVKEFVE